MQDITKLNATDSVEALDEFLSKFAAQRPGLPDRTASPVLRINTPQTETIHHHASTTPAAPALYQQRPGMHQLPMGAGTTSKPATPIHLLGGSKPGTPSAAARGAAGSSPNGAPAAASGTIRRTPPLPSGGGLGTPTHGRRAASPATATGAVPGSSSRPASSTSPMAQLQQLRAGQGSFSATGAMEGALTATPPSVPPRPRSRTPSTAGSLTAGAAAHFGLQGGGGMADTLDAEMSRGLGSPPPSGTGGGPSAPGHRASGTGMGNSMNMAGGGNGSRPGSSTNPSGGMHATADGIPRSPMLAGPRAGGRLSSAGSQRSLTHATAAVS